MILTDSTTPEGSALMSSHGLSSIPSFVLFDKYGNKETWIGYGQLSAIRAHMQRAADGKSLKP